MACFKTLNILELNIQLAKKSAHVVCSPSSPALLATNTFDKAGLEREVTAGLSSWTVELERNAVL